MKILAYLFYPYTKKPLRRIKNLIINSKKEQDVIKKENPDEVCSREN